MLEVRGLRVEYGHIQALRGVDLQARPREITAIIGSNGAGKTSTLMAVSGLAPITGGEILMEGKAITRTPAHQVTALGISQILEGRQLFADQTVEDNLLLGGYTRLRRERARVRELSWTVRHRTAARRSSTAWVSIRTSGTGSCPTTRNCSITLTSGRTSAASATTTTAAIRPAPTSRSATSSASSIRCRARSSCASRRPARRRRKVPSARAARTRARAAI